MRQRPTLHSPSACALALLCCLSASGCDSRQLVAPQTRTIAPASRDASDGGALIGSAAVAADQTGGVPLGGTVPEFTYVLVQVGGQYDGKPNPACAEQPPNWPCILNAPLSDFYDLAPYTTGPVQTWAVAGGTLSSVPLRGSGGSLNTPGQAIGLYYGEVPAELRVRASVNNFVSQNPNPGGGITSWIISGAYNATAREINPLAFNGGPTGDADGTVTFSVAPTAPLKFINPDGVSPAAPPGDPSWYFVPGESVPQKYGPGAAYPIDACFRQTTCTYTPQADLNGRMQVVAYVENRIVIGRSDYVRGGQEPTLTLTCNGQRDSVVVERASTIHCNAATSPTTQTVGGWTFVGENVTIQRSGAGANSKEWDGIMVKSGTIRVEAPGSGLAPASIEVHVTDRKWTEAVPPVLGPRIQGCAAVDRSTHCFMLYPPTQLSNLGSTRPYWGIAGGLENRAAHVDTGPNAGFSYVAGTTSPIFFDSIVVYHNKVLYDPNDELWRRQKVCSQRVVLAWATQHEETHVRLLLEGIRRGAANGVSIEASVYFESLEKMRDWLRTGIIPDISAYVYDMGDRSHTVHNWGADPCPLSELFTGNSGRR